MTFVQIGDMDFPAHADWGWLFNGLVGWDDLSNNKVNAVERPRGHGSFRASRSFRSSLPITLKAAFLGSEHDDLRSALTRLSALGANGPVEMRVTNVLGTFSREVTIENIDSPDTHGREAVDGISIDMLAADPRKYGPAQTASTELPTQGTGIVFPVTFPLEWGQPGTGGRITLTNTGKAPTVPSFYVANGGMSGVTITDSGSGRRLTLDRPVSGSSVTKFDGRTRRVSIDGVTDVSAGFLTRREWMTVGPGETATYLFSGTASSGTPTLTGELKSAWW